MNLNDFAPQIFTAVITGLFSAIGVYVAMSNRLSVLEVKVDSLTHQLDNLVPLAEKVAVTERDLKTAFIKIDDNKRDIEKLEGKINGL